MAVEPGRVATAVASIASVLSATTDTIRPRLANGVSPPSAENSPRRGRGCRGEILAEAKTRTAGDASEHGVPDSSQAQQWAAPGAWGIGAGGGCALDRVQREVGPRERRTTPT
jgi:hypothetical protein